MFLHTSNGSGLVLIVGIVVLVLTGFAVVVGLGHAEEESGVRNKTVLLTIVAGLCIVVLVAFAIIGGLSPGMSAT